MFKDIRVYFDQAGYDVDLNQSIIQGWAIDPVTKSPVEVECDIPCTIYKVTRPDIKDAFKVFRDIDYGFLIQFPGSLHELKPTLTFKTKDFTKTYGGIAFDLNRGMQPAVKLYKVLVDQGILPALKNPIGQFMESRKASHRPVRDQPFDNLTEWRELVEPNQWTPEEEVNEGKAPKVTAIVTFNGITRPGYKGLTPTFESLKDQAMGDIEIMLAATREVPEWIELDEVSNVVLARDVSTAVNKAVESATGDYLLFIDYGDHLSEHYMTELTAYLEEHPNADFIYADNDMIDDRYKERYESKFKPDYDEILLRSHNYILHPVTMKKSLFEKVGGMRPEYQGLQNYDLTLRATKEAEEIGHIHKILYHWNRLGQKALTYDDKQSMKEYKRGVKMLNDRFGENGERYELSDIDFAFDKINESIDEDKISIVIGVPDGYSPNLAVRSANEILKTVENPNVEIVAVNLPELIDESRVKHVTFKDSTKRSEVFNYGAEHSDGDILVFLNEGFKAVEMCWLKELVNYIKLDGVGIVAPKFYEPTYRINQAGVEVRDGKRYNIGYNDFFRSLGYNNALRFPREVFAVSDDCMVVDRKLFEDLNGFNTGLKPDEADIDFCIRARKNGQKVVVHNNVSASLEEYTEKHGKAVSGLTELYSEEELENSYINDNLKPGVSALEYISAGV